MSGKPWSQACENNKQPILEVLRDAFATVDRVLEIGSGTGQHARYFAEQLTHLDWQPTDLEPHLPGIELWCADYSGANLLKPVELDVTMAPWRVEIPGGVFTANTLHIMPWDAVCALFEKLGACAPANNRLVVYGPFNYRGRYTSDSNERFDHWLKDRYRGGGIRGFEAVDTLAAAAGYRLQADHAMPANNRCLVWRRSVAA